jgi:hypothetical protein
LATSAKRSALKGRKSAHHGTTLTAVLLKDELHHVVFAVVCEINVNVRKFVEGHPFLVQETPEVKAEPDRTHVGNPQAIADERIRRAAARDPFDTTLAACLEQIPSDEEIILIPNIRGNA